MREDHCSSEGMQKWHRCDRILTQGGIQGGSAEQQWATVWIPEPKLKLVYGTSGTRESIWELWSGVVRSSRMLCMREQRVLETQISGTIESLMCAVLCCAVLCYGCRRGRADEDVRAHGQPERQPDHQLQG